MMDLEITRIMNALGWTIFHSLWQILAVSMATALLLYIFRDIPARIKYAMASMAMVLSLVWVGCTFIGEYRNIADYQAGEEVADLISINPGYDVSTGFDRIEPLQEKRAGTLVAIRVWLSGNAGILSLVWLIGVVFFSLKTLGGFWYTLKIKNGSKRFPPEEIRSSLEKVAQRLKIGFSVRLYESLKVSIPVVIGFIKPVIIVPVGFLSGLPLNQVEAIMAHELAHVKRLDYLVNMVQTLLEILFFYHPAFWWISSIVRREREHCCDDLALTVCEEKIIYIKALSSIQERHHQNNFIMVAFSNKKFELLARMQRILKRDQAKNHAFTLPVLAVLVLVGLLALKPISHTMVSGPYGSPDPDPRGALHLVAALPASLNNTPETDLWIKSDTVTKKGKKAVQDQDLNKNKVQEEQEEKFQMDIDTDWDFDFDLDFPEFEFPDTLHSHWMDVQAHLNESLSHFEFFPPEFHVSDSFFTFWDDIHIDLRDAFKDLELDFPELEFDDTVHIDKEELRRHMEEMRKEMEYFNSKEFRQEMDRARMEMKESLDQLREEMKQFRELEWPRLKEEIEKALEEQRKQQTQRNKDTLNLHPMGYGLI